MDPFYELEAATGDLASKDFASPETLAECIDRRARAINAFAKTKPPATDATLARLRSVYESGALAIERLAHERNLIATEIAGLDRQRYVHKRFAESS
jgi:hypothetical protein